MLTFGLFFSGFTLATRFMAPPVFGNRTTWATLEIYQFLTDFLPKPSGLAPRFRRKLRMMEGDEGVGGKASILMTICIF
jgi:hypothetical protein